MPSSSAKLRSAATACWRVSSVIVLLKDLMSSL
jgi:hypothetical protein